MSNPKASIVRPVRGRGPANIRTPKPFLELAQGDPVVLNQIVEGFEKTIKNSFAKDPAPSGRITANMVRERFQIMEKWFRTLRGEKGWGVVRILDMMPDIVHAELNGVTWEPDHRLCWMPGDGR